MNTSNLSAHSTDGLVNLLVTLDAIQGGFIAPDSADREELLDENLLAAVLAELGSDEEDFKVIEMVTEILEERHQEIRDGLAAFRLWGHRTQTWGGALMDAADAARAKATVAA